MAKMIKKREEHNPDILLEAIKNADVWVLVTAEKDKKGATVSVRESYGSAAINVIAMLLEQKEIFDAVQAKIAQVKMMDAKKGKKGKKPETDINVN